MDKQHFVSTVPLYTYVALKKWFYFSIFLYILCFISCLMIEVPLVLEWYEKRALYNKQKNIYTEEQELLVKKQSLEKTIQQLDERRRAVGSDQTSITSFLKKIVKKHKLFTVFSVKKVNHVFVIEGTGDAVNDITDGLKQLAEEIEYTIRIQSIEKKNRAYVFNATCYKKNKSQ